MDLPYSECFAARRHPRCRDADRGVLWSDSREAERGDRAYESDPLDAELRAMGIEMIAPHHKNEK
jgi:hypothetical protein